MTALPTALPTAQGAIVDVFASNADGVVYSIGREDGVRRWNVTSSECDLHIDIRATVGVRAAGSGVPGTGTAPDKPRPRRRG